MKESVPTSQNGTGSLKQSLEFKFEAKGSVIEIIFLANDYWDFVNSGVDGYEQGVGAKQNKFGTTYSFSEVAKSQSSGITFNQSIKDWIKNKGLTADDGNYDGLAYVIMRAVKRKGIKPTEFVNKALNENSLTMFEEAVLDAFESMI